MLKPKAIRSARDLSTAPTSSDTAVKKAKALAKRARNVIKSKWGEGLKILDIKIDTVTPEKHLKKRFKAKILY